MHFPDSFANWGWQRDVVLDNDIIVYSLSIAPSGKFLDDTWQVPFALSFPLPLVCATVVVSEATQTESTPQARGEAEIKKALPADMV